MNKKELYTLVLKFKRHKIEFRYDKNSNSLIFGRSKNLTFKYIIGILMIILGLYLAGLVMHTDFPPRNLLKYLFLIVAGLGVGIIMHAMTLSKNSKYEKIFGKGYVELKSKKKSEKYLLEDIERLSYTFDNRREVYFGKLILFLKDKKEIELLTLTGENKKHLKADFDYLTKVLNNQIGLQ